MRIGIYGGAFNPVHNGHIVLANLAKEHLNLDKLILVPTFIPPHRDSRIFAPFERRFRWLEIAFEDLEGFEISDYEKKKGGVSYSIETVRHFSETFGVKPFFIIGEDSAINFDKWYRYEELMEMANFAVYPRFRESRFDEIRKKFPKFILMDLPMIEISSTEIRRRISLGKPIRGMVPTSIENDVIDTFREVIG